MIPVSLFIFDLDGTLIDSLDDIALSVNEVLASLGRDPVSRDKVRQSVGDGARVLMERTVGDTSKLDEAVVRYKDRYRLNFALRSRLYPGVPETLERFRSVPMAVVSNKASEFVEPVLKRFGIDRYFRATVGADSGLPLKPAPDALLALLSRFHAAAGRTVIVGDGVTDITAGRAAGVITCGAAYGFRSEPELRAAGADHLVHAFSELTRLFTPVPA